MIEYNKNDWKTTVTVSTVENIGVGTKSIFRKQFTVDDVELFARISGDTNKLHLDEEYASDTMFGTRVVHGTLVSGVISAALARFPGTTVYLSQSMEFKKPVFLGNIVEAVCEVIEVLDEETYRISTTVTCEDEPVITGEATIIIR